MAPGRLAACLLAVGLVSPSYSLSQNTGQDPVHPAVTVSVLQSAIFPGWGEFGLGKNRRGRIFTRFELALWASLLQAGSTAQRYDSRLKSFGSLHAGASFSGKDDRFVTDVGNYMSLDDFNQAQQRLREPDRVYRDAETYGWTWENDEDRKTFRQFRISRETARKAGRFIIGGMVLNRILSIIDVTYLHRLGPASSKMILYPQAIPQEGSVGLGMTIEF